MLSNWLQAQAGTLPQALAMDGKMIRNHIGLLTLAQHEDGAPQTIAIYDQKEGTERCEQTAAGQLLQKEAHKRIFFGNPKLGNYPFFNGVLVT